MGSGRRGVRRDPGACVQWRSVLLVVAVVGQPGWLGGGRGGGGSWPGCAASSNVTVGAAEMSWSIVVNEPTSIAPPCTTGTAAGLGTMSGGGEFGSGDNLTSTAIYLLVAMADGEATSSSSSSLSSSSSCKLDLLTGASNNTLGLFWNPLDASIVGNATHSALGSCIGTVRTVPITAGTGATCTAAAAGGAGTATVGGDMTISVVVVECSNRTCDPQGQGEYYCDTEGDPFDGVFQCICVGNACLAAAGGHSEETSQLAYYGIIPLLLAVLVAAVAHYRLSRRGWKQDADRYMLYLPDFKVPTPDKDYEIEPDDLSYSVDDELGEGHFGQVYRGQRRRRKTAGHHHWLQNKISTLTGRPTTTVMVTPPPLSRSGSCGPPRSRSGPAARARGGPALLVPGSDRPTSTVMGTPLPAGGRAKTGSPGMSGSGSPGMSGSGSAPGTEEFETVAVKLCNKSSLNSDDVNAFLNEAGLMKGLDHPNVLRLVGEVTQKQTKDTPILIVLEFCGGGDLLGYLRTSQPTLSHDGATLERPGLDLVEAVTLSAGVANGVEYLHAEHRIVHRDLAARNCLVAILDNGGNQVKISDFGLSRRVAKKHASIVGDLQRGGSDAGSPPLYVPRNRDVPLPVRWMSLESIIDLEFSFASDVWSLAVVLFEIFSRGTVPYESCTNTEVIQLVRSNHRLGQPLLCPDGVYQDVMLASWQELPVDRPTAAAVATALNALQSSFRDERRSMGTLSYPAMHRIVGGGGGGGGGGPGLASFGTAASVVAGDTRWVSTGRRRISDPGYGARQADTRASGAEGQSPKSPFGNTAFQFGMVGGAAAAAHGRHGPGQGHAQPANMFHAAGAMARRGGDSTAAGSAQLVADRGPWRPPPRSMTAPGGDGGRPVPSLFYSAVAGSERVGSNFDNPLSPIPASPSALGDPPAAGVVAVGDLFTPIGPATTADGGGGGGGGGGNAAAFESPQPPPPTRFVAVQDLDAPVVTAAAAAAAEGGAITIASSSSPSAPAKANVAAAAAAGFVAVRDLYAPVGPSADNDHMAGCAAPLAVPEAAAASAPASMSSPAAAAAAMPPPAGVEQVLRDENETLKREIAQLRGEVAAALSRSVTPTAADTGAAGHRHSQKPAAAATAACGDPDYDPKGEEEAGEGAPLLAATWSTPVPTISKV